MGRKIIHAETKNLDRKGRDEGVNRRAFEVHTATIDVTEGQKSAEKINPIQEIFRKAMGGFIKVIADTVEAKDPYTASHQRRVADLARAIGGEMGLAKDQQNGLRLAGIIHDLGKVSIPEKILSKHAKLTKMEYKLIQTHSQKGHDLLKYIDFPWPLAEIVLQHHERLNGTGYPRGLKEEDITPGSPDPYGGRCGRGHGFLPALPSGFGD